MTDKYPHPDHDPDKIELLTDHPIFSDIFNIQAELDSTRYETQAEAHTEGIEIVHAMHDLLDEAGLLGKEVSLEGFDIMKPAIMYNAETGAEYLQSKLVNASSEPLAEHPPIEGAFYGFYPIVKLDLKRKNGNEEDEDGDLLDPDTEDDVDQLADTKYYITLHYRICTQEGLILGNYVGGAYALGSITDSHITFAEDKQEQGAAVALNALAKATESEAAALASAKLETLLTPTEDETVYDQHRLHEIGNTLRDLERQQGISMKYRDAVLDLVTARLGAYPGAAFAIEAENGFMRRDNKMLLAADTFKGNFAILGLEFVPQYIVEDGEATRTDDESLAVIIPSTTDGEDRVHCCIPFQNITSLEPIYVEQDDD